MLGHCRALKAVSAKFPEVLFPSLADDTFILGPGHLVGPAFTLFREELAKLNLSVKTDKCLLYGQNLQNEVPHLGSTFLGVPASEEGIVVLNNPIGTPEFVAAQLEVILQDKLAGIQELPRLGDSQVAFSLLTKCFHTRPHYTLRGTKIGDSALPQLRVYEEKLLQSHDEILGYVPGEFPALARQQATLPVSKGGMGLVPLSEMVEGACIGAWSMAASLISSAFSLPTDPSVSEFVSNIETRNESLAVHLRACRQKFTNLHVDVPSFQAMAQEQQSKVQHKCLQKLWRLRSDQFLADLTDPSDMARFRSVRAKHAGAWLDPGADDKDTEISHQRFLTACRLRLGLPHPQAQFIQRCNCGEEVDKWGHHFLHCKTLSALVASHNSVRDLIGKLCAEAGISVLSEVPGQLLARDGTQYQQRTDLVLQENSVVTLVDISIRNPCAPSRLSRTRFSDLQAAKEGENQKSAAYSQRPRHTAFLPAVFESFGAWGPAIQGYFAQMSQRWMQRASPSDPGAELESIRTTLSQKISAAVIKGTVLCLHHKFRSFGRHHSQDRHQEERNEEWRTRVISANARSRMRQN